MGLNNLRHAEDASQLFCNRWDLDCKQSVAGFCRRDQMANRADTANAGHQRWHLRERATFTELFETTELRYMEASVFDMALLVEMNGDLGVALNSSYRVNYDRFSLCHGFFLCSKPRLRTQLRCSSLQ